MANVMAVGVRQIGLIGLGPHAKRIYYPLIEKYARSNHLNLVFLIELAGNEEQVCGFLSDRQVQPKETFFAPATLPENDALTLDVRQFLNGSIEKYQLDGVIIACEPKSHKAYLKWALEANVDVLIDKPIICPVNAANDREAAEAILQDFNQLEALYQASESNVVVQTQRRSHLGYLHIYDYLSRFLSEFQIPITHIEVSHADGMWMMPNEWERENHSYKHGTGKLMHSGYHFVDLLAWFLKLNQQVQGQEADELDMVVRHFSPSDFMHQLNAEHYQKFFQQDFSQYWSEASIDRLKQYGELDVFMLAQFKRQQSIVTTTTLNLQQNSFSSRAWSKLPADPYKGNGRIRHEQVNIHVSMLLNIQVHSYQSYQINDPTVMEYGAGHLDHFDILIFRNSGVLGGKAFDRIEIGKDFSDTDSDLAFSHNETARENLFLDFLKRSDSRSDLSQHRLTNELLSRIYQCLALERSGKASQLVCPLTVK